MRVSIFFTATVFLFSSAAAAPVTVPFVGCPSDGQTDAIPAPEGKPVAVNLPPAVAARLAFYKADIDSGVLAPRGWHCANLYGSNGWFTVIAQEPVTPADLLADKPVKAPAIQVSISDGETSGRFKVAQLVARFFPKYRSFTDKVIAEGLEKADDFPAGPYKDDKLIVRSPDRVEYITPAGKNGLGTASRLVPCRLPIHAVAALEGADDDGIGGALVVVVRLPKDQDDLAPVILGWAKRTYLGAK
jgi:hypothetical protein